MLEVNRVGIFTFLDQSRPMVIISFNQKCRIRIYHYQTLHHELNFLRIMKIELCLFYSKYVQASLKDILQLTFCYHSKIYGISFPVRKKKYNKKHSSEHYHVSCQGYQVSMFDTKWYKFT